MTAFSQEIDSLRLKAVVNGRQIYAQQIEWLMGPSGEITMDALLRFENLEHELDAFSQHIGWKHGASVETTHKNRSIYGQALEEEFTPEIVAFVQDYFREDFEVFGYDLAFPPQRPSSSS